MYLNNSLSGNNGILTHNFDSPNSIYAYGNNKASNSTENGVQFAPSFLFGQPNQGTKRRQLTQHFSNTGGKSVHWSPLLVKEHSSTSPTNKKDFEKKEASKSFATSSLWNGPPLRSISDEPPPEKQSRIDSLHSFNTPEKFCINTSINFQPNSNEKIEISNQNFWITVFGFSLEHIPKIIEVFSKHGNIVSHQAPKSGNWVNIRYSSTIHSNQALARNGQLINGMMIGVIPCKNQDVFNNENTENQVYKIQTKNNSTLHLNINELNDSTAIKNNQNDVSISDVDFVFNGSRIVPSVSANANSMNESNNTSRQSRLSMSSRNGMRPLNGVSFIDDKSLNSSTLDQHDNSLFGKFWNYISHS